EDRRQVVRIVVVAGALAARPGDRVRESPLPREGQERRFADLARGGMIEGAKHVPQEDVAREVVRLTKWVVGRRLGGRDQAERRSTREEALERLAAGIAVSLAPRPITGQARVVGDEERWIELLVELERDILRASGLERGAWPRALRPLGDVEEPRDEPLDGRHRGGVLRRRAEQGSADV